jgi:hypothetical protein
MSSGAGIFQHPARRSADVTASPPGAPSWPSPPRPPSPARSARRRSPSSPARPAVDGVGRVRRKRGGARLVALAVRHAEGAVGWGRGPLGRASAQTVLEHVECRFSPIPTLYPGPWPPRPAHARETTLFCVDWHVRGAAFSRSSWLGAAPVARYAPSSSRARSSRVSRTTWSRSLQPSSGHATTG